MNMQSMSPNIFVRDLEATIEFYRILGFETTFTVPAEKPFVWAMMTNGSVNFMFQIYDPAGEDFEQISRQPGGSLLFYINVNNIREYYADLKDMVTILKAPETTFYGATEFSIVDCNGYVLAFAQDE